MWWRNSTLPLSDLIANSLYVIYNYSMQARDFYVYHLIHKEKDKIFYVGKGHGNRVYDHLKLAFWNTPSKNSYLYRKIRKLVSTNQTIISYIVSSNLSEKEAFLKEKAEISRIGRKNLCNMTDGGEGFSGGTFKQSDHQKETVSKLLKGKSKTEEHKKKLSQVKLGKSNLFLKGKSLTEEHKRRLSEIKKGKKLSTAHIENIKRARSKIDRSLIKHPSRENHRKAKYYEVSYTNGNKEIIYSTISGVAIKLGVEERSLWKLIKEKGISRKGFSVRPLDNYDEQ